MSLITLPNHSFPISAKSADGLMHNLVQLNILDAGLTERQQRGIGLLLKIYELRAIARITGNTALDYAANRESHDRLMRDALAFAGLGNSFATRYGDVLGAHLAIAYHNAAAKTAHAGLPPIPDTVAGLLADCADLVNIPAQTEERVDLYATWCKKRRV